MRKELLNFKSRIPLRRKRLDAMEFWREGANDDLLLAAAIACWWAERGGNARYRVMPKPAGW
jgi:hypothetical protein